jgi:hypothetical protein
LIKLRELVEEARQQKEKGSFTTEKEEKQQEQIIGLNYSLDCAEAEIKVLKKKVEELENEEFYDDEEEKK